MQDNYNHICSPQEVHELLTQMLEVFASYCEKHDLRYYLVGGTLLGAVRHQGFIPWDDDIDVGMPRADYEQFLELVRSEPLGAEFDVVSDAFGNFAFPYAEILRTDTLLKRESGKYIEETMQVQHLFIDIFPQDGWPDQEKEQQKLLNKMNRNRFLIRESRARLGKGNGLLRTILKTPMVLFAKMLGNKRISRHITRVAKKIPYDQAVYVGSVTNGIYGMGEICRRDELVKFGLLPFEGRMYPVPGCWDSYLKGIYGDYMTIPQEADRIDHKMTVLITEDRR